MSKQTGVLKMYRGAFLYLLFLSALCSCRSILALRSIPWFTLQHAHSNCTHTWSTGIKGDDN